MWVARRGMKVAQHVEFDWPMTPSEIAAGIVVPLKDQVLTIRDVVEIEGFGHPPAACFGLRFEEIRNPQFNYRRLTGRDELLECSFWIVCFRPVHTTDISALTSLLAGKPKVPEMA